MTINERAAELFAQFKNKKKVEAYLIIEDYAAKDIAAALKSLGVTKKRGFAAEYYDFLSACKRTKQEANDYIMGEGEYGPTSQNVQNHLSHYLNIHALTVAIWDSKAAEEEIPAGEDDGTAEFKREAWAFHDELEKKLNAGFKPTKADRLKSHPDKVAHLGDEALTKAFTELNKRVNEYFDRKRRA